MQSGSHHPDDGSSGADATAIFRRFHDAWSQGDLDAVLALVEPDVIARPMHGVLYSRLEFTGRDGIVEWFHEMTGPWDRFEAIVEHAEEAPGGVKGLLRTVGYRDEEPLHARMGIDCRLRNGRIATLTARDAAELAAELRNY